MNVEFLNAVGVEKPVIAVIAAKYRGQWVFCRHKGRTTFEAPAGHREPGETIEEAARRELYEETGAVSYSLNLVGPYRVTDDGGSASYGMLFCAEILKFGQLPAYEMSGVFLFDDIPGELTYPDVQPVLLRYAEAFMMGGHRQDPAKEDVE
jgi:8-oxo-dGTP diphosphatase